MNVNTSTDSESNAGYIAAAQQQLVNQKLFSRSTDPEVRLETAKQLFQARSEQRQTNEAILKLEQQVAKVLKMTADLDQAEQHKQRELTERTETLLTKIKALLGFSDGVIVELESTLQNIQDERGALFDRIAGIQLEITNLRLRLAELPKPAELLEAYYEKMANLPLTMEQKYDLLRPEVVSSLSMEQYIALWKRLNPFFLSHVTRQGFKEDSFQEWSAGAYFEGFSKMLTDRAMLRPLLFGADGVHHHDRDSLRNYLEKIDLFSAESEEEAVAKMRDHFIGSKFAQDMYPDTAAVHLADNAVLDKYYGAEKDNQIFVVFPSDIIASQYPFHIYANDFFGNKAQTLASENRQDIRKDVLVWSNDLSQPGINLNTGIVFLPRSTRVDPNTGSKYQSRQEVIDGVDRGVLLEDEELIERCIRWATTLDSFSQVMQAFAQYRDQKDGFFKKMNEDFVREAISRDLLELGFASDIVANLAYAFFVEMSLSESLDERGVGNLIRKAGAHFKRPTNTVSSQEYWTALFSENTDLEPKHVVYYDGDPTAAVLEFQRKHGIGSADTSDADGPLLGFDNNHVADMQKDPRSNHGKAELIELAEDVIREQYSLKSKTSPP